MSGPKRCIAALAVMAALVAGGCRSGGPPLFPGPGPAKYQQAKAQRFDPYPQTTGAPQVVGSRPPGYEFPPAEPLRARWIRSRP